MQGGGTGDRDRHTVTNKIACSEFYDLLTNKCVDKFNERRKCLSIRFSHFSSLCSAADEVAEAGGSGESMDLGLGPFLSQRQ